MQKFYNFYIVDIFTSPYSGWENVVITKFHEIILMNIPLICSVMNSFHTITIHLWISSSFFEKRNHAKYIAKILRQEIWF